MRHDPVRLADKFREQAKQVSDREAALILYGIAGGLDQLAGKLEFMRKQRSAISR